MTTVVERQLDRLIQAVEELTKVVKEQSQKPDPNELLPVSEAAKVLGIGQSTLERGYFDLPVVRIGRRVLYRRQTLDDFARARERQE